MTITKTLTLTAEQWAMLLANAEDCAAVEGYGHFNGGDPRDFTPDVDCSTDEERAAHKRDCEAMEAGGQALMPPTGEWHRTKGGGVVHYHRPAYGLGVYVMRDPDWVPIVEALRGKP